MLIQILNSNLIKYFLIFLVPLSISFFLSLFFLALNLFVLYYLLGFFYIFEYYCLICVLHIIISVNLLLPITSTNFIRIRITKVCFISYYLFSSFIKQQIMIFMPKMTSIKCHCTVANQYLDSRLRFQILL